MTFDPTKPAKTREGNSARIVCINRNHPTQPILALILADDGKEYASTHAADGTWSTSGNPHEYDLVNIPAEPAWRPWNREELPLGTIIRVIGTPRTQYLMPAASGPEYLQKLFSEYEWAWAHEQFTGPWRRCGVEVKP